MRSLPLVTAGMGRLNLRNSLYFSLLAGNFGGEQLARDCALRHAVWTAEKFGHPIQRNTLKMPILAIFARQPGLERTDCSAA